jgi:hypothetical protein
MAEKWQLNVRFCKVLLLTANNSKEPLYNNGYSEGTAKEILPK